MTGVGFWYYLGPTKPKVIGIVNIVLGILTLAWCITSTLASEYYILSVFFYLTGVAMMGIGFWYYFWKSRTIQ